MRYLLFAGLLLVRLSAAKDQPAPAGWKAVKDAKGACRIMIPENWAPTENPGSAVFENPGKGIAVVTTQSGQTMKPLTASLLKLMDIPKDKIFENSASRIFYQDKVARNVNDSNSFSVMVPGKGGACSSRVVFISVVPEEVAKRIALSVEPVPE